MSMVERVARVLAEKQCARDQARAVQGGCDIYLLPDGYMPIAREDARAAIEAMREASIEMEDAGQEIIGPCYVNEQMADPGKVWSAMIDAALK